MENEVKPNLGSFAVKNNIKLLLIVGASTVITALIVCYVFLFWQKSNLDANETKNQQEQMRNLQQYKKNQEIKKSGLDNYIDSKDDESNEDNRYDPPEVDMIDLDKITVEWNKKLKKIEDDNCDYDECYLAGKITNDDPIYKDKPFYLEVIEGLGYEFNHYTVLKDENGNEYKEYAESGDGENNIPIEGISDLPDEITYPNTNFRLKKHYYPSNFFSDLKTNGKFFSNRDLGDVFLTEEGCMVIKLPDQTAIAYDLVIPFISENNPVVDVTFNNGKKNEEEYGYTEHTCAAICTELKIVDTSDLGPSERLESVGKTVNGDDIFRIKDPNDKYLKDLYDDENTMAYMSDDYQNELGKNKYSYDEFMKLNPYLYWKDPLGRWIEFKNSKFEYAAEMCKPVVYLYPQETTVLGVKVSPNGGFTKTEPAYEDGWRVEADPSGKLTNLSDGSIYDSLFWEGIGLNYPVEDKGWIVKKSEIDQFLSDKLKALGLNEKEISDFKEYWVGKLNEKPYYQISFLTRNQFDFLAPLEIFPQGPDTLIRIMMTAKGLDSYQSILPQTLPETPSRSGFTVVEWGGTLLK